MEEKNKKNKDKRDVKVIECSRDLIPILDSIGDKVTEFSWGVVELGYYEKTKMLAQKLKSGGFLK